MTDRTYRIFIGLALLVGLFFDSLPLVYGLVAMMFFEGITDLRLPLLVCKMRNCAAARNGQGTVILYAPEAPNPNYRFDMEAERVLRIVFASTLLVTYYYYEQLWFFPWFMGFALFGAGVSGLCPVLLAIRWVGFR